MAKPIRGKGGKFAGSEGEGKTRIPTAGAPVTKPMTGEEAVAAHQVVTAFKAWQQQGRRVIKDEPTGYYVDRDTGEILDPTAETQPGKWPS